MPSATDHPEYDEPPAPASPRPSGGWTSDPAADAGAVLASGRFTCEDEHAVRALLRADSAVCAVLLGAPAAIDAACGPNRPTHLDVLEPEGANELPALLLTVEVGSSEEEALARLYSLMAAWGADAVRATGMRLVMDAVPA